MLPPSLPWQASSLAKAAEMELEMERDEQLFSVAPFPGGSFSFCPPSADFPPRLAPGQPAAGALSSILLPRKLDFLQNFPSCFALSLFPTAASLIFFVPLSHSQHSASSSCKRNVPLHSKTSLYSQALPSPPKKKSSDNCVFRLHRGKRFVPLCTQELRFGH